MLHRALRSSTPDLSAFAAGVTMAAAIAWAALQALDGVTLNRAVDAWAAADGAEEVLRFADAETVRWLVWGLQAHMYVLLGMALLLFGAAMLTTCRLAGWTGWVAVLAGILSIAVGGDVTFNGLGTGFQQITRPALQAVLLVFAVGISVAAARGHTRG